MSVIGYTKAGADALLANKEATANKGVANGYAPLDGTGKVPSANLPTSASTLPGLIRAVTVAYAATVTPDAASQDILNIGALTANITIANPTGTPVDGQSLRLRMSQNATGAWTVSFGTAFAFGTDVPASTVPTAASAKWELLFLWNAADAKWRCAAIIRGF